MNIVLTGLPGSGKSTLGKALASRLNLPFYDLDVILTVRTGQTIAELFSEKGEDYFRQAERSCLLELIRNNSGYVLASGGGTPCYSDNLQEMKFHAKVVFLNTPVDTVIARLQKESELSERPLFSNSTSIGDQVQNLLAVRLPFYLEADIIYNGANPDELAKLLSGT